MPHEENPYQAPAIDGTGLPDAPPSHGWVTNGKVVTTGFAAHLPMVDPFTGGVAETMMLRKVVIPYRPLWLWGLPVFGTLVGLTADLFGVNGVSGPFALLGAIGGWILSTLIANHLPACTLHFFIQKETQRRRVITSRMLLLILAVAIASLLLTPQLPGWPAWLSPALFLCWVLGNLTAMVCQRRLHCRRTDGGRLVISGFHPLALEALVGQQERAARRPPARLIAVEKPNGGQIS